jgi:hypothetical protein
MNHYTTAGGCSNAETGARKPEREAIATARSLRSPGAPGSVGMTARGPASSFRLRSGVPELRRDESPWQGAGTIADFGPKGSKEGTGTPRGSNGEQGPQGGPTANRDPKGVQRRTGRNRKPEREATATARPPVSTRNAARRAPSKEQGPQGGPAANREISDPATSRLAGREKQRTAEVRRNGSTARSLRSLRSVGMTTRGGGVQTRKGKGEGRKDAVTANGNAAGGDTRRAVFFCAARGGGGNDCGLRISALRSLGEGGSAVGEGLFKPCDDVEHGRAFSPFAARYTQRIRQLLWPNSGGLGSAPNVSTPARRGSRCPGRFPRMPGKGWHSGALFGRFVGRRPGAGARRGSAEGWHTTRR